MALGFTPHHAVDLNLETLTHPQFIAIAVDIVRQLEWDIRYVSESGVMAYSGKNLFSSKSEISIRLDAELAHIRSESIGSEVMDMGRDRKNVDAFTSRFDEIKNNFSPEELAQKYEDLQITHLEDDVLSRPPASSKEKMGGFLSLFIPKEGYFITPILVDLNILIFLLMVFSGVNAFLPDNASLLQWGANFKPLTLEGEWWRLITNCFIHIGVIHLLMNMYALIYIGVLLEPYLGKARFAGAYLLTGIIASLTSLAWHDLTLSAGASGAIFGMYGVFLAMLTTNLIDKGRRNALLASIGIFVGYNLVNGMKGGIDNAAHLGGLVSGLLIGYLFYPGLKDPANTRLQYSTLSIAVVLVLTTAVIAYKNIPDEVGVFQRNMDSFEKMEKSALSVYKLLKDAPKEKRLAVIKDTGIYYWNKNIELLQATERLKIPETLKDRTLTLIEYCNIRIDSYNYLYRELDGTASEGEDSTNYYKSAIMEVLNKLKEK
jgi:rhomboid protease GluP